MLIKSMIERSTFNAGDPGFYESSYDRPSGPQASPILAKKFSQSRHSFPVAAADDRRRPGSIGRRRRIRSRGSDECRDSAATAFDAADSVDEHVDAAPAKRVSGFGADHPPADGS